MARYETVLKQTTGNLKTYFGFDPFKENEWVRITDNPLLVEKNPNKYKGVLGLLAPIDKNEFMNRILGLNQKLADEIYPKIVTQAEIQEARNSKYLLFLGEKNNDFLKITKAEKLAVVCQQLFYLYDNSMQKRLNLEKWYGSYYRFFGKNIFLSILGAIGAYFFLLPCLANFLPIFSIPIVSMTSVSLLVIFTVLTNEFIDLYRFVGKMRNEDFDSDRFAAVMMGSVEPIISLYEKMNRAQIKPGSFYMKKYPRPSWKERIENLKVLDKKLKL